MEYREDVRFSGVYDAALRRLNTLLFLATIGRTLSRSAEADTNPGDA
jgi:hypothetical protein